MTYRIEILRSARKQFSILPHKIQVAITPVIDLLKENPRPVNCRKLKGSDLWRVRIERYRVIYTINDKSKLIQIVKIASRREDTYQGL